MADDQSPEVPELVAFNRCSDSLRRGIHPDDLIPKLFSGGILSAGEKSEANNYMFPNSRRTQIMLDAVGGKVGSSPRIFHDLVRILANEPAYAAMARKLREAYQRAAQDQQVANGAPPPSVNPAQPYDQPGNGPRPSAPEDPRQTVPFQQPPYRYGYPQQPQYSMQPLSLQPLYGEPHPQQAFPPQPQPPYGQEAYQHPFRQSDYSHPPYASQPDQPYGPQPGKYSQAQQPEDDEEGVQKEGMPLSPPPPYASRVSTEESSSPINKATIAQPEDEPLAEAQLEMSSLSNTVMVFGKPDNSKEPGEQMVENESCDSLDPEEEELVAHLEEDSALNWLGVLKSAKLDEPDSKSDDAYLTPPEGDPAHVCIEEGGEGYNSLVPGVNKHVL